MLNFFFLLFHSVVLFKFHTIEKKFFLNFLKCIHSSTNLCFSQFERLSQISPLRTGQVPLMTEPALKLEDLRVGESCSRPLLPRLVTLLECLSAFLLYVCLQYVVVCNNINKKIIVGEKFVFVSKSAKEKNTFLSMQSSFFFKMKRFSSN